MADGGYHSKYPTRYLLLHPLGTFVKHPCISQTEDRDSKRSSNSSGTRGSAGFELSWLQALSATMFLRCQLIP